MALVLDGVRVREAIKGECRPRIARLIERIGRPPGLAVILAGSNPASQVYVGSKTRTAAELGIYSETLTPPESVTTDELLAMVAALNARTEIDGILIQLPLPAQVDAARVLMAVDPAKDVDGFHPLNVGLLSTGRPGPRPCTPAGIIRMLKHYEIPMAGRRAVVVGRSDIVGKPMAMLLLAENATVTIAHSRTADLAGVCREADLLVAAIGRAAMVTKEFIQPGATVVDVGMNRITSAEEAARVFGQDPARMAQFEAKGSALVGDVDPRAMAEVAGAYTPVPGGVGPLTIAMLMVNTIESCERAASQTNWPQMNTDKHG
ncbi:bifunctional methylenetetrahydrofolate dehydrogenase/methenyltetrahydrofolate cyclohydrolase FolD [Nevskia soli]|uniref:bifunctional methylenetetrahydrofolate dehydrogenase/methenyltetrahydrofolate cyclohydrolase FolD n=1 Tax=Nevskia soli TaxID=418856 RepID=UPI0015D8522A|nr:bifunctional methylenetetrahydrofolate dehydrogenase/methenyltetrahydrofolate cyclohydrolase FolD [Nevskia soli]